MMIQLHIVRCKGVSLLVDQALPVLLMEQLMSSLHAYLLHPDNGNLLVGRKCPFYMAQLASGLNYLLSCTLAIIHRDLTTKRMLLDSELRSKIADFGTVHTGSKQHIGCRSVSTSDKANAKTEWPSQTIQDEENEKTRWESEDAVSCIH